MSEQESQYGEMSFEDTLAMIEAQRAKAEPVVLDAPERDESVEAAPEPREGEEAPVDEPEKPETDVKADEATPTEEPPVEPPRSLARLMAREQKVEQREAALKQREAELEQRMARQPVAATDRAEFAIDPTGVIRDMLPENYGSEDLKRLAQELWYEADLSGAPSSYRAMKEARAARRELHRRDARAEQEKQRTSEAPAQQGIHPQLQEYADSLLAHVQQVDEAKYPLLARMATKHRGRAASVMFAQAQEKARATHGSIVYTAEQAAEAAEKALRADLEMLGGTVEKPAQAVPTQTKAPQATPEPESLRNQHSSIQSDRTSDDPFDDETLHRQAMEALRRHREGASL